MGRSSALSAGALLAGLTRPSAAAQEGSFRHGVASGDPLPDGVVLWTRLTGSEERQATRWTLGTDPDLTRVVRSGQVETGPDQDFTVHAEVPGLEPDTTYYFAFDVGGARSPVGRTRTAPAPDSNRPVRLGVLSCGSYAYGRFNAYRLLAERDVDLVVHLGDSIYEGGGGTGERRHQPDHTLVSLADYRTRHAQYREDADLRLLLQRHPVAAVWDDHEIAGNAWRGGAGAHDPDRHGTWDERRAAATRAWREWMPVRPAQGEPIWRSLRLGRSAELLLLDTRIDGRDQQVSGAEPDPAAAVRDPNRSLIGEAQRQWLHERLRSTETAWHALGNQVMLSPLQLRGVAAELAGALDGQSGRALEVDGRLLNPDQWDGYVAERERLLAVLAERPGTTVVLTGDTHSSWASEVPSGPETGGGPPVAVEIVTPAVASETFGELVGGDLLERTGVATGIVRGQNPHLRWADLDAHGYTIVELRGDGMSADWWHVETTERESDREQFAAGWDATLGDPRLVERPEPLGTRQAPLPARAPRSAGDGDGLAPWVWGGATTAVVTAAAGGLIALRRRRT